MASARPTPYTLATLRSETALQLSHLDVRPAQPLRLRSSFRNSSRHVKSLVVEATSHGIASFQARRTFGFRGGRLFGSVVSFDSLPPGSAWRSISGPRPDLGYEIKSNQWVAAEARGRTARPFSRLSAAEFDRAQQLNTWASAASPSLGGITPKWFMTWSHMTESGTDVHFLDPGEPAPLVPESDASSFASTVVAHLHEGSPRRAPTTRPRTSG